MNNGSTRGPIAWMAANPVAANILMLFFLLGGLLQALGIRQEVFPEFDLDMVTVSVAYPGAGPEEVEQGVVLPVEEALRGLEGIDELRSQAFEDYGVITAEARLDTDVRDLAQDIRDAVARIATFPEEAEEPVITVPLRRRGVITVLLHGGGDFGLLRRAALDLRDRLLLDPAITQAELTGDRPVEIGIELHQDELRARGLTVGQVAARIRAAALDLPGGVIDTASGRILVRMRERRDTAADFGSIPVFYGKNGGVVLLRDVARISDGFEETDTRMTYDGRQAIGIEVFRVGDQTPVEVARAVRRVVGETAPALPAGIQAALVNDRSVIFTQRLGLLLKNGALGLCLVFLLLGLFLEPRLAFWVTMGIPVSFLGSLFLLPAADVSINMVSMFAFIVSLGIVVDDTIIIGENVFSQRTRGLSMFDAAVAGAREMAVPVTFSVLTNIVTFLPLYFVPGVMGKIFRLIPVVVIAVFTISLIEALFVLPAHIGHGGGGPGRGPGRLAAVQATVSRRLDAFIRRAYTPAVTLCLRWRYLAVAAGIFVLLGSLGLAAGGHLGMTMFPRVESDYAYVRAVLPVGVTLERTEAVRDRLEAAAREVAAALEGPQVEGMQAWVDENTCWVKVYLAPPGERVLSTGEFTRRWRQAAGRIPGVERLRFRSDFGGPGSGPALSIELRHRDPAALEAAAHRLAAELGAFPNVSNIDAGFLPGKRQMDLRLRPVGYHLGLTPAEAAMQVRDAFYGHEALRQLRGRDEVRVMVRLDEAERRRAGAVSGFVLRSAAGGEVPLVGVATMTTDRAPTEINRRNGRRVLTVTADVRPRKAADQVLEALQGGVLPGLMAAHPGLSWSAEGKHADRRESMAALGRGMLAALLMVYVLLAIPFRSYAQPAIIMSAIPFGVVGAVLGHVIMGYSLSIMSMFGIVALSGVVVNDSLILVDLANRKRRAGQRPYAALVNAAVSRFRPIILTTLTTFLGLMPMIFEDSLQARFLIPMALSLGFGILFATVITLLLVPCLYLILDDAARLFARRQKRA